MTFSIKLWVLIRHKNISDKYHKSLIKKCYGPALKAPSSDQSVRPPVRSRSLVRSIFSLP